MRSTARRLALLPLLFAATAAAYEEPPDTGVKAPADLMADSAALHAALTRAIGRPVHVLELRVGPHYGELRVQEHADPDIFDDYEFTPGGAIKGPEPQKVGQVDCKKLKVDLAKLDLAVGTRVLGEAMAIATRNGFETTDQARLGPDILCKDFGWRFLLQAVDNDDAWLELVYALDGRLAIARRSDGGRWRKVDPKTLAQGSAAPAPKAPEPTRATKPGGSADWAFLTRPGDLVAALAELERFLGEPLRMKTLVVGAKSLSVELFRRDRGKDPSTYLLDADGAIRHFNDAEAIPFDCNKPFGVADAPLAQLPALVDAARGAIPPLQSPDVTFIRVGRSFSCGRTEVTMTVEDARAEGSVTFDDRGRIKEALLR